MLNFFQWLRRPAPAKPLPFHLVRGRLGETTARSHLQSLGFKFLTANFKSRRGEIDLIFRDRQCLVFVEVKTRSSEEWTRPAAAVNRKKKKRLSQTALEYLRQTGFPEVPLRFDVVEVLLEGGTVGEVRHLPGAFSLSPPFRYW